MTATATNTGFPPASPGYEVIRITQPLLLPAAERLVGRGEHPDRQSGKRFLAAAEAHAIDLTHLWATVDSDRGRDRSRTRIRQVALAVPGIGRTAMLFTSNAPSQDDQAELAAAVSAACDGLPDTTLAQALLEPGEVGARSAFFLAGFSDVGRLAYMRRATPAPGEFTAPTSWGDDITVTNWKRGDDPALAVALERSYVDTLDCPELCGLRSTADVIASHRGTGTFDPRYWWIVRLDGEPHGALLFNPCPDQATVELVYVGLGPSLRGRGLGKSLMQLGLSAVASRPERAVTCAVDQRNAPARRLYERLGFESFAERLAMVRGLRTARG